MVVVQTTIRASGPADLIAYSWFRMGFRPSDSLTFIGMRGGRRAGVVARIDLPPDRERRAAVAAILDMIVEAGEDGFVLVVSAAGPPGPRRSLVRAIRSQARSDGLDLLDAFLVGEDRYVSLVCTDRCCCPPQGRPVTEILASQVAAAMVAEGSPLYDDENGLVADVEPVGAAFGAVVAVPPEDTVRVTSLQDARVLADRRIAWWYRWLHLLVTDAPLSPAEVSWLIPALESLRFRDAVLLSLPWVVRPGGDGSATPTDGVDRRTSLATEIAADVLCGGEGDLDRDVDDRDPDEEVVRRARDVLATVARTAPAGRRAEALAVLAWLAWWEGDGVRARLLVDRTLQDQPGHRLGRLVGEVLGRGVPPQWVLRRRDEDGDADLEDAIPPRWWDAAGWDESLWAADLTDPDD